MSAPGPPGDPNDNRQGEIREFLRIYKAFERSQQMKDILWNIGTVITMLGAGYLVYHFVTGEEQYPDPNDPLFQNQHQGQNSHLLMNSNENETVYQNSEGNWIRKRAVLNDENGEVEGYEEEEIDAQTAALTLKNSNGNNGVYNGMNNNGMNSATGGGNSWSITDTLRSFSDGYRNGGMSMAVGGAMGGMQGTMGRMTSGMYGSGYGLNSAMNSGNDMSMLGRNSYNTHSTSSNYNNPTNTTNTHASHSRRGREGYSPNTDVGMGSMSAVGGGYDPYGYNHTGPFESESDQEYSGGHRNLRETTTNSNTHPNHGKDGELTNNQRLRLKNHASPVREAHKSHDYSNDNTDPALMRKGASFNRLGRSPFDPAPSTASTSKSIQDWSSALTGAPEWVGGLVGMVSSMQLDLQSMKDYIGLEKGDHGQAALHSNGIAGGKSGRQLGGKGGAGVNVKDGEVSVFATSYDGSSESDVEGVRYKNRYSPDNNTVDSTGSDGKEKGGKDVKDVKDAKDGGDSTEEQGTVIVTKYPELSTYIASVQHCIDRINIDNDEEEKEKEEDSNGDAKHGGETAASTDLLPVYNALSMYLSKIVEQPHIPRYRRISVTNKTFKTLILPHLRHDRFLALLGFVKKGTYYEWLDAYYDGNIIGMKTDPRRSHIDDGNTDSKEQHSTGEDKEEEVDKDKDVVTAQNINAIRDVQQLLHWFYHFAKEERLQLLKDTVTYLKDKSTKKDKGVVGENKGVVPSDSNNKEGKSDVKERGIRSHEKDDNDGAVIESKTALDPPSVDNV